MVPIKENIKKLVKSSFFIYPVIVIIAIPLLLAFNTIWNLRSFNRDVNFLIRHQAIGIADTLKPTIEKDINNKNELNILLFSTTRSNEDIIMATIVKKVGEDFEVVASSTSPGDTEEATQLGLNQLAVGFNQPFAGLSYDPHFGKNVWNVVVPLSLESEDKHLLFIKLKTDVVETILGRTSRDSLIILIILIATTFVLLANHFVFYKKAIKAQQLAEIDKLKDEFFSMASHELRTPVTAITGYIELIRDKLSVEENQKVNEDFNILEIMSGDLKILINDLLDVSRLEQHRLKVSKQNIQVNDIVSRVISSLYLSAKQKGLIIKFTPYELPEIKTDPDRVRQVLTNLLGNSIKYTLKGEIIITVQKRSRNIEITVKDTGVGIPADHLSKLFTKFHRVKDQNTREVRGSGLGLWISKQIVELLGGKIQAESIYGTGTSITFTLPLVT